MQARALLIEAARALHDAGTPRWERWARGFLGLARAIAGEDADAALVDFAQALRLLEEVGDASRAAHLLAFRAVVHASRGDRDAVARDLAAAAERTPEGSMCHAWTIDISQGQLDVLDARKASSPGEAKELLDRARDRLVRATWPSNGTLERKAWPWGQEFYEPTIAAELLERAILEAQAASAPLGVARDGSSLELPDGQRVSLGGKRKLQSVLVALVTARIEQPGVLVSGAALIEAGWPGERLIPSTAQSRLHVALDTLKKVGLRALLVGGRRGWMIDPAVPCVWGK